MKKRIFAAAMALCLTAGTSVFAQDAKQSPREQWTPEQMAQKKTDRMTETLKLDQKQSKQLYDYNLEQIKQMQAKREQMKADRMAEAEKMKGILTPEQFEQWKQMQAQQMSNRKGGGMHQGGQKGMHREGDRSGGRELKK